MRAASSKRADTRPRALTQAAYARHRHALGLPGGTREGVRKAVAEGRIDLLPPPPGRRGPRLIDPAAADPAWAERSLPKLTGFDGSAPETLAANLALVSTRSAREDVRKRLDEFRLAQALRETVRAADILDAATEASRLAHQRLFALARRLGPVVAACADPLECTRIIEREIALVAAVLAKPIELIPGGHEAAAESCLRPRDELPALPPPAPAAVGRFGR